ncbi:MAG: hypothetical protein Ct9H90mP16_07460 [Candidatus Poseidoniales archaeon]|nr:MAG: hypothetical protein Ct9H90mP16_07460 [Candidatus Poseidoniales archaeon]
MGVDPKTLTSPLNRGVSLQNRQRSRIVVGKATHLKDRVRSYFAKNPDREMIPTLVAKADLVDCIVTSTPGEALILERQLIREHKPQ